MPTPPSSTSSSASDTSTSRDSLNSVLLSEFTETLNINQIMALASRADLTEEGLVELSKKLKVAKDVLIKVNFLPKHIPVFSLLRSLTTKEATREQFALSLQQAAYIAGKQLTITAPPYNDSSKPKAKILKAKFEAWKASYDLKKKVVPLYQKIVQKMTGPDLSPVWLSAQPMLNFLKEIDRVGIESPDFLSDYEALFQRIDKLSSSDFTSDQKKHLHDFLNLRKTAHDLIEEINQKNITDEQKISLKGTIYVFLDARCDHVNRIPQVMDDATAQDYIRRANDQYAALSGIARDLDVETNRDTMAAIFKAQTTIHVAVEDAIQALQKRPGEVNASLAQLEHLDQVLQEARSSIWLKNKGLAELLAKNVLLGDKTANAHLQCEAQKLHGQKALLLEIQKLQHNPLSYQNIDSRDSFFKLVSTLYGMPQDAWESMLSESILFDVSMSLKTAIQEALRALESFRAPTDPLLKNPTNVLLALTAPVANPIIRSFTEPFLEAKKNAMHHQILDVAPDDSLHQFFALSAQHYGVGVFNNPRQALRDLCKVPDWKIPSIIIQTFEKKSNGYAYDRRLMYLQDKHQLFLNIKQIDLAKNFRLELTVSDSLLDVKKKVQVFVKTLRHDCDATLQQLETMLEKTLKDQLKKIINVRMQPEERKTIQEALVKFKEDESIKLRDAMNLMYQEYIEHETLYATGLDCSVFVGSALIGLNKETMARALTERETATSKILLHEMQKRLASCDILNVTVRENLWRTSKIFSPDVQATPEQVLEGLKNYRRTLSKEYDSLFGLIYAQYPDNAEGVRDRLLHQLNETMNAYIHQQLSNATVSSKLLNAVPVHVDDGPRFFGVENPIDKLSALIVACEVARDEKRTKVQEKINALIKKINALDLDKKAVGDAQPDLQDPISFRDSLSNGTAFFIDLHELSQYRPALVERLIKASALSDDVKEKAIAYIQYIANPATKKPSSRMEALLACREINHFKLKDYADRTIQYLTERLNSIQYIQSVANPEKALAKFFVSNKIPANMAKYFEEKTGFAFHRALLDPSVFQTQTSSNIASKLFGDCIRQRLKQPSCDILQVRLKTRWSSTLVFSPNNRLTKKEVFEAIQGYCQQLSHAYDQLKNLLIHAPTQEKLLDQLNESMSEYIWRQLQKIEGQSQDQKLGLGLQSLMAALINKPEDPFGNLNQWLSKIAPEAKHGPGTRFSMGSSKRGADDSLHADRDDERPSP